MSKIALLFPGQGSQKVGMGKDIVDASPVARSIFKEADQSLSFPLSEVIFNGPEEKLRLTYHTQPALLTTSIALYQYIQQKVNIKPAFVAGHSLGEYSALVAAGSLSFADAVVAVHQRGLYMDQAVPAGVGAMSAVLNLDREKLDRICEEVSTFDSLVQVANYNCPGQIVISGHVEAVLLAAEKALSSGARKVVPLTVSGPFHSALMKPAAEKLQDVLTKLTFHDAVTPVISNVSAKPITRSVEVQDALVKQVASPVLWEDTIRYLLNEGIDTFMEIGPGTVLAGLVRKIDRKVKVLNVYDFESVKNTIDYLQEKFEGVV